MPRPWGGRRLEALFGKTSPSGRIGEVWLLADHERCASRVVAGAHEGRALD